jgi:membrane protein implicated in regulation of membrane protease activity
MTALEVLILVVFVLWLLGALVVPIGGNAIHVLIVIVLVLVVVRLVQGRRL